jgi:5-methyltetrahydropteroyltriglutamate--homocysteine methyltransferase
VPAIDRAREDIGGTTVVHLCFGEAATVTEKPTRYSFLPKLTASAAQQIAIEAA